MAPVHKTMAALKKPELLKVAASPPYSLEVTNAMTMDIIKGNLASAMALVQECDRCEVGICLPAQHRFSPDEYTPSADMSSLRDGLSELLRAHNIDVPVGFEGTDFVTGGAPHQESTSDPVQAILRAATEQMSRSSNVQAPLSPPSRQQGANSPPPSPDPTQNLPTGVDPNIIALMKMQQENTLQILKSNQDMMSALLSRQTPPVQPPLAGGSSAPQSNSTDTDQNKGKLVLLKPINPRNAQHLGVVVQPKLRVEGDLEAIDMSKLKRKLVSGRNTTGASNIVQETNWPHHMIPKLVLNPTPSYDNLTSNQFYYGYLVKILSEADPKMLIPESQTENKLRFLSHLAKISFSVPWKDVLDMNATFLEMIEQNAINFSDWEMIESWLNQAMEAVKTRHALAGAVNPAKKQKTDDHHDNKKIEGLDPEFIKTNLFCIKFQINKCENSSSHEVGRDDNRVTLKHECAGCFKLGKPASSSHGAKSCPNKRLFQ